MNEATKKLITETLDSKEGPELKENSTRRAIMEAILDTQIAYMKGRLNEDAPTNVTAGVSNWEPVMIQMIRRAVPQLLAFDLFGVQPMKAPTQAIFALRSRYTSQTGDEALFNEANSGFSGTGTQAGDTSGFAANAFGTGDPTTGTSTGTGMALATAEALSAWAEMGLTVEQTHATAGSRKLKAKLSNELIYDMKNVHGLDAQAEMLTILSNEMRSEMDREFLRTMNISAKLGAQNCTTAGRYDLKTDADGRWLVEKFKGLLFQIEMEANQVSIDTRMGRANRIVMSANVASALNMAGLLQYNNAELVGGTRLNVDPASFTFAGVLLGKYQAFVDPFATIDYVTVGYKGDSNLDSGIFFAPYLMLQQFEAKDPVTFNPVMGLSSRYALVANPWAANTLVSGVPTAKTGKGLGQGENQYFRKIQVANIDCK